MEAKRDLTTFRLIPFQEASDEHQPHTAEFLNQVKRGYLVKLQVKALGHTKPCAEAFWVLVLKVDRLTGDCLGLIDNRMARSQYHNLKLKDMLEFNLCHVLEIGSVRVENKSKFVLQRQ